MKICGIVVEYNPFHNGHIHHIQETKKKTNCDLLIAVMSGFFNQRGQISIIDKQQKIQAALDHGVDLVIELPIHAVLSNADIFAYHAIECLNLCKVDEIVFGSESNNLEELKEIASFEINVNHLKENLKSGHSFAKSYGLLCGTFESNDILAIAYLKAIQKINPSIKARSIQRSNSYHSVVMQEIASATAIRHAVYNHVDYTLATPIKIINPQFNEKYFSYLQTLFATHPSSSFQNLYLIQEGIEKHLANCIKEADNYEDFLTKAINRRYTKARIERSLMTILLQLSKKDVQKMKEINFIRVLGFNEKGQSYLKKLKKERQIATNFNQIPTIFRELFYKGARLYCHQLNKDQKEKILKQEISGPIIV